MSKKRMINTKMWKDVFFQSLTSDQKLVWIYLLTNECNNILGVYEITSRTICYETNLEDQVVIEAMIKFQIEKKILIWKDTWIIVINFMKNQSNNSSMLTGAKKIFETLPKDLQYFILDNSKVSMKYIENELIKADCQQTANRLLQSESKFESKSESKFKKDMFENFWKLYHRRGIKKTAFAQWKKLSDEEIKLAIIAAPLHVISVDKEKYLPYADRWIRDKHWLNEVKPIGRLTAIQQFQIKQLQQNESFNS